MRPVCRLVAPRGGIRSGESTWHHVVMLKTLSGTTGFFAAGAVAGGMSSAAYFARRMVSPEPRVDDVDVVEVTDSTLTLGADAQTRAFGRYGLWFDGGHGHARIGEIVREDPHRVVRVLEATDFGTARVGGARFNGYYFAGPPATSLGVGLHDVHVDGPLGPLPAWHVPADGDTWAILVHGRGALRAECLRAVPTLHDLGHPVLIPAYRNDQDAPRSSDGLYHLGLTEWEDLESAMQYAVEHGARSLVLVGWSMGGAIVLQALARSWMSSFVRRVVLNAPVIDWGDVMDFHAHEHKLPASLGRLGQRLMRGPWARSAVGLDGDVDVRRTDWVARAAELSVPMLLIHSLDDEFVPVGPSERLARRRPDLVTMPKWGAARHCREWNLDPDRWEQQVRQFLQQDT